MPVNFNEYKSTVKQIVLGLKLHWNFVSALGDDREGWLNFAVPKKQTVVTPTSSQRSESTEDHLERIQELVDRVGYARVSDLADSLDLNRSTVSNMVRRLAHRGYVNYQRYRGFTLTPEGRAIAKHIKERHRTLTELLELLGLEPETISEEVEDIEHHLKPQTLQVFASLARFWRDHPESLREFLRFHRSQSPRNAS